MTVLRIAVLLLVAAGGLAVVLTREPLHQTMVVGVYGLLIALLFFLFQAPDVSLSQIVVSTVALPVMILLTLAKVRQHEREGSDPPAREGSDLRERKGSDRHEGKGSHTHERADSPGREQPASSGGHGRQAEEGRG